MKTASKTNQIHYPKQNRTLKNQSKGHLIWYICGCGKIFSSKNTFKYHVLQIHDGQFIEGSSHYISKLLEIVTPIPHSDKHPQQIRTQKKSIDRQNISYQSNHQYHLAQIKNQEVTLEEAVKTNKIKDELTFMQKLQNISEIVPKSQNIKQQQENYDGMTKPFQYNDLFLVANPRYKKNNFYCGNCYEILEDQNQFCQHVTYECYDLNNQESSHFLISKEEFQNQNKSQVKSQQSSDTQYPLNYAKNLNIQPDIAKLIHYSYRNYIPTNLLGIFQLIKNKKENQREMFICGCSRIYKHYRGIMSHLAMFHSYRVPLDSSHIILRSGLYETTPCCLKLNVKVQNDQRQIWSCPCLPNKSMKVKTFIDHTIRIHQGISPLFKILRGNIG